MLTEIDERAVPLTADRVLTELAQSRRHLDAARRSLELALEIVDRMDLKPNMPTEVLRETLGQLEEAEATLWGVAR